MLTGKADNSRPSWLDDTLSERLLSALNDERSYRRGRSVVWTRRCNEPNPTDLMARRYSRII